MTRGGGGERAEGVRAGGAGARGHRHGALYDCFTYMVLAQLEDYGFCEKGQGGPWAESGAPAAGRRLPTNTSGGQLSEGHVEGMLQIVEAVRQVRQDYGADRQVPDARSRW